MKFRPQRRTLEESMAEAVEVNSLADVRKIMDVSGRVKCEYYCYDDRINWDTWLIIHEGWVIGMSNGKLNENNWFYRLLRKLKIKL